ncbi:hypothetical protein [Roseimicrobium sp. ORNL1]|uniref:hypothetical protein n=1 Tax=Roseimicrobium sp. ORNL1 TaxID=2711231 RepID=UPI0013E1AE2F|nr:hypothetical protein [Roseimicrobium sp. ORNL1]QIF01944.1 hypothetical protein G5S37_10525 [Roseimicrobium sp. ORNL1]
MIEWKPGTRLMHVEGKGFAVILNRRQLDALRECAVQIQMKRVPSSKPDFHIPESTGKRWFRVSLRDPGQKSRVLSWRYSRYEASSVEKSVPESLKDWLEVTFPQRAPSITFCFPALDIELRRDEFNACAGMDVDIDILIDQTHEPKQ